MTSMGKKYYFYGDSEVKVKGSFTREIIGGLINQKVEDRKIIIDKFTRDNEVATPVRDDFSPKEVKLVLQALSS